MEAGNEAFRSDMKADFSRLSEDLAKRDRANTRWTIGLVVAAVIVMGIIVRWPGGG